MTQIKQLGLTKLFLWSEAERFQTYPQALARLEPGRVYTRQEIGTELFGLVYVGGGKPRRENVVRNLFGALQIAEDKLLLRGINLFRRLTPNGPHRVSGMTIWERADDEWKPTEAALHIGDVYRQAPNEIKWQQLLAEQLARYESRTRVLLYLLSHGHTLRFELPGYFAGNAGRAELVGEETCALFDDRGIAFNSLLYDHQDVAIGPWWCAEIENAGFELASDYALQGAAGRSPSVDHINSAIKRALYIFYVLGILVEQDGTWRVDTDAFARHLAPDLCRDLLGSEYVEPLNLADEWARLAYVLEELADERGFIISAQAANRWGELSGLQTNEREMAFDVLIRRGIFEERVQVIDRHTGQPRMGRGLLGDDNMRLVRLRVLK